MADPEVWQALLNTGNPYWQQQQRNKGLAEMLAIEKAQRGLRQEEQLQELFSRSQKPSVSEVGAVMPSYVPDYAKAQYEGQKQSMELDKQNYERNASVFGPIAERAMLRQQQGVKDWQGLYNNEMGDAAREIVDAGGRLPNNFNAEMHDPLHVLTNSMGFGYKSPFMEQQMAVQKEQMLSQVNPRRTPEQAYGTPPKMGYNQVTGLQELLPGSPGLGGGNIAGGQPAVQSTIKPYPVFSFDGKTYEGPEFMRMTIREKDPAKKQRMEEIMDTGFQQQQAGTLTDPNAVVMPPKTKQQAEIETEKAKLETKADVERTEEGKRITESFKRAMGEGGVSRVMNLIANSTSGPTETLGADIASRIPKSGGSTATTGMVNIGKLGPIAKELKKTIERSPGPQSDKDVAIDALAAASIDDPKIPYNQRMEGFLEFVRIIKERANSLGIDPKELGIDVDTETGPVKVKTKAEAEKLAPGTLFETPDGKILRRH